MEQNRSSKFVLGVGLIGFLSMAVPGFSQALPEGEGKEQFQRVCSGCHGLDVVTKMRYSQTDWAGVVNDMVSRGAQGKKSELDAVVNYLGAHFNKTSAPAAEMKAPPNRETPSAAPSNATPLSAAEVAKGTELLDKNGCLGCHRIGEKGSRAGPDLSAIGSDRSAEEIKQAIVAPDAEVLPENRGAYIVTKDGITVTGRLLNQDGFSVQIIDSNQQLRSFLRKDLREYKIVEKGLMPSYSGKLSGENLEDLVQYLSSLKGSDQQ